MWSQDSCWDNKMCPCFCSMGPAFEMTCNGPKLSLPSWKPGHYFAYWYSMRVHILRLLLSCIPVLCTDVTIFTCTTTKKQHNIAQPNTTQQFPQISSQREGGQSAIPRLCLFSMRQSFLCSLWQLNTKKRASMWCGEGKQVSITSPETPGASMNKGRNRELGFIHWYRPLK